MVAVIAIFFFKQTPAASPLASLSSAALAPTLQVSAPQAPVAQASAAQASVEEEHSAASASLASVAQAPTELPEVQLMRALSAGTPTLAFFHSLTCDSCKEMTAIVAEVYPDYADAVALVDVDVYDERNAALLSSAGIRAIPTVISSTTAAPAKCTWVSSQPTICARFWPPWRKEADDAFRFHDAPNGVALELCPCLCGRIVTSLGPCNVATVPLIVGFVGGSGKPRRGPPSRSRSPLPSGWRITFMLLGVVAALIGSVMGIAPTWWYYLVAAVCILIGLNMLGALPLHMPAWFEDPRQRIT